MCVHATMCLHATEEEGGGGGGGEEGRRGADATIAPYGSVRRSACVYYYIGRWGAYSSV